MLDLWEMRTTLTLRLLCGVVAPDRVLSMSEIELLNI